MPNLKPLITINLFMLKLISIIRIIEIIKSNFGSDIIYYGEAIMKRKILIIVIMILIILNVLTFGQFGTKKILTPNGNVLLTVPLLSFFTEECCMFSANFKSFRGVKSLNNEIKSILNKYKKIECDGKEYYYNDKDNFTITEYRIKNKLLLNEFWIVYDKGNYCD